MSLSGTFFIVTDAAKACLPDRFNSNYSAIIHKKKYQPSGKNCSLIFGNIAVYKKSLLVSFPLKNFCFERLLINYNLQ